MLQRLTTRVDPHLLAVLLLALIAALPLLVRPSLPRHSDLELHVFRAAEFQGLLRERPLEYPRWAPNFYYGHGYPIFNYYAPLTYFAASVLDLGFGVVVATKIVLVLTFISAALGMYYFARRHMASTGAIVSSAAFLFSPYILFIDPFMRGDVAEFLSLGILPWVFLAFDRPLATKRDLARSALTLAALVFSHNLLGLIGAAMLAAWLVWRGIFVDGAGRWPKDLAAIMIAIALTAVYWLPFVIERDAVLLDVAGVGHFDFHNHFVSLGTLLRPSPILDLGATAPHFIYNIGFAQWLFALPAVLVLRSLSQRRSRIGLFFVLMSLLLVWLITPASAFFWEAIPSAAFVQFPWRFLGPLAFTLALCAGYAISALQASNFIKPFAKRLGPDSPSALATLALLSFALPTMYLPDWQPDFGDPYTLGSIEFELSGVALGTTSTGDFLPRSVTRLPPPTESMIDAYRAGRLVDRFDYASTGDASVTATQLGDLEATYTLDSASASAFTARFFIFAFDGWQAHVDGQPVPSRASEGDGFISFEVPQSARSFGVRFGSTPLRTASMIVTLAAVTVIAVLFIASRSSTSDTTPHVSRGHQRATILIVLAGWLLLKSVVIDNCGTCFRYTSPPQQSLAAMHKQVVNVANHISLLGFDVPHSEVQSGEALPLTLYWAATAPVPINYQVFAHLTRPAAVLWGQSDKLNPGDFPSTRWPLDKYVWDDHVLHVLPGTPPGEYILSVGLYTLGDGRRAPVFDASGNIVGDSVQLNLPIRVIRASRPPAIDSLGLQVPLNKKADDLTLLGASLEQSVLTRPNVARIMLYWQAHVDAPTGGMVRVRWIDEEGRVVNEIERSPGDTYSPSSWRKDEIVRDVFAFWLPPEFDTGSYVVQISLSDNVGLTIFDEGILEIEVID